LTGAARSVAIIEPFPVQNDAVAVGEAAAPVTDAATADTASAHEAPTSMIPRLFTKPIPPYPPRSGGDLVGFCGLMVSSDKDRVGHVNLKRVKSTLRRDIAQREYGVIITPTRKQVHLASYWNQALSCTDRSLPDFQKIPSWFLQPVER
jgi:hypothetical protein